jgi:hypothetical protein
MVAELGWITTSTFSPISAGRLSDGSRTPSMPTHRADLPPICGDLVRIALRVRGFRVPSLACRDQFGSRAEAAVPMTGSTIGSAIVAGPGTLTNLR